MDAISHKHTTRPYNASAMVPHLRSLLETHIVADEINTFRDFLQTGPVSPNVSAEEIRARLAGYDFSRETSLAVVLQDVGDMMRRWTVHANHPRYFGLFVPGTHDAGIWGDALTALYNPQLGAWWHAPAASEIERHTLRYLARVLGYSAAAAHFTSGASEANLLAVLCAVATAHPGAPEHGLGAEVVRDLVYVSAETHHSIHKAVRVAGLGTRAIRVVECDPRGAIDVGALRDAICVDLMSGFRPLMIVGTVGTTAAGGIDDLEALATIAHSYSMWFHVDAAWGGAGAFLPQLRDHFRGIERAHSVAWDAHKSLAVPMGAGMFFCSDASILDRLFNVETNYVPRPGGNSPDLYGSSLQWSRRFIGLKVFLTLAVLGEEGIRTRVARQIEIAGYLRGRLTDCGWMVLNDTPLPIVCFGGPRLQTLESATRAAESIARRGKAWISATSVVRRPALRACITHDETSTMDVDVLCEELAQVLVDELVTPM